MTQDIAELALRAAQEKMQRLARKAVEAVESSGYVPLLAEIEKDRLAFDIAKALDLPALVAAREERDRLRNLYGCKCEEVRRDAESREAALRGELEREMSVQGAGEPTKIESPIPLNAMQQRTIKEWARDDRLWTTQETVEFNLRSLARAILRDVIAPTVAEESGLREAVQRFIQDRGRHDGEHVYDETIQHCQRCEEAYIKAEAVLDAALAADRPGEPQPAPTAAPCRWNRRFEDGEWIHDNPTVGATETCFCSPAPDPPQPARKDDVAIAQNRMALLTDEERLEVLRDYCRGCGGSGTGEPSKGGDADCTTNANAAGGCHSQATAVLTSHEEGPRISENTRAEESGLREENERLRRALEFYADKKNYSDFCPGVVSATEDGPEFDEDGGAIARAALAAPAQEKERG